MKEQQGPVYEIIKRLGKLEEGEGGRYTKLLNIISWFDKPGKLDIRTWDTENDKMGKGISLSKSESIMLRDKLNEMDLENMPEFDPPKEEE